MTSPGSLEDAAAPIGDRQDPQQGTEGHWLALKLTWFTFHSIHVDKIFLLCFHKELTPNNMA